MIGVYEFPNGKNVTVVMDKGHGSISREMLMFGCSTMTDTGEVVTATFGYRGNFWRMDRYGNVQRVANGKYVTLGRFAMVKERIHGEN